MGGSATSRRKIVSRVLIGLAVLVLVVVEGGETFAQQSGVAESLQNLSPDQMRQMFSGQGSSQLGSGQDSNLQSQTTILEPTGSANPDLQPSRLERIMSARAGVRLTQFGYDQMGVGRAVTLPQVGEVISASFREIVPSLSFLLYAKLPGCSTSPSMETVLPPAGGRGSIACGPVDQPEVTGRRTSPKKTRTTIAVARRMLS